MADFVGPDQTVDMDVHCLLRPTYHNTKNFHSDAGFMYTGTAFCYFL